MHAVADATAEAAAVEALINHVGLFGHPESMRTDGGCQYQHALITEYQKVTNTSHNYTAIKKIVWWKGRLKK